MKQRAAIALLIASSAAIVRAESAELPADQIEFFEKKIRPVLVAECYECHAGAKQKGGLRLDSREALRAGGESGPALVPGDPGASLLIRSIAHLDPELKMPNKAPKLDDAIITDFAAWVKMGAPDPRSAPDKLHAAAAAPWAETLAARRQWWCFQPVRARGVPAPRNLQWSAHPVDRFLLAKQEQRGLEPGADADLRTLLRRLSFAITGLPPETREIERFVSEAGDNRQVAIENTASRLLALPAFGERWARHWMDLVRYAETYGSEHDYLNPHAWRYRDYLVRAFNADLPYDRFVQEQIAGDLLAPRWNAELGINEALLATAWHRMIESYATPVDVKREEATVIDWQIEALGKTFLGLTIQCARCHDHKFDPISDEDFYALYGVFASTRPTLSILDDPSKLTVHDAALTSLKEKLRTVLAARWQQALEPETLAAALSRKPKGKDALQPLRNFAAAADFPHAFAEWRARFATAGHPNPEHEIFADFSSGDLGGWRVSGPGLPATPSRSGVLSLGTGERFVRAIQPSGFFSDAISERHGGALRSPEFVIRKSAVSVLANGAGKARLRLVIENFQNDLLLFAGVNPDLATPGPQWVTMPIKEQWLGRRARIELLTRDDKTCVGEVKDQVAWAKTDGRSAFGICRVVLHDGAAPAPVPAFAKALAGVEPKSWRELVARIAAAARAALDTWTHDRASDDDARLLHALLEGGILSDQLADDPAAAQLAAQFRELESKIPPPTRAPGVCDDGYSHDSPLFPRGEHSRPAAPVPRRFPEVLGGRAFAGSGSGRLELAREITRADNPLAARVMVNRIWQHLTGRGLAATPDNFGRMGEKPTHPELLDHLAAKFIADGWSTKRMIRYIVTSRSWQLSAAPPPDASELDANNDLLAHARVRRLEAETIRDAMLAVAGNLVRGHSGPGIPNFYRTQIDPDKQAAPGPVDGAGRRSIYLEARRLFPSEFLAAFDAPKPNIFTGRRSETNVPAQSLALLNDPFVQHQAGKWAERVTALGGSAEERVAGMYLEAFARAPNDSELRQAIDFLRANSGEGWRELAHALLNTKEFIFLR